MEGRYQYGHYIAPNGLHYDTYQEYKEDINMENNINVANVTVVENTTLKEDDTMTNMTVKELRSIAKEAGIRRYSKMNKTDLIAAIKFFTDEERKANEAVVTPVIEEPVDVGDLSITRDNPPAEDKVEDKKEELWDKLLLSVQKEYIAQSYKKRYKALFYRGEGEGAVYHVVARRLWAVTAMVIDKSYGKGTANESNVLQTVDKLLERGIISKLDNINKEWQTRYYATPQQMNKMFFTVHPKKEVK